MTSNVLSWYYFTNRIYLMLYKLNFFLNFNKREFLFYKNDWSPDFYKIPVLIIPWNFKLASAFLSQYLLLWGVYHNLVDFFITSKMYCGHFAKRKWVLESDLCQPKQPGFYSMLLIWNRRYHFKPFKFIIQAPIFLLSEY